MPGRKYAGISPTSRVLNILDCVVIEKMGGAENAEILLSRPKASQSILAAVEDIYVDVSQNPCRRSFTGSEGISKCIHTASCLYSYKRDGIILPFELMLLQGHALDLKIPDSMRQKQLHDLASMGISLPCLGMIIVSLMLTTGL